MEVEQPRLRPASPEMGSGALPATSPQSFRIRATVLECYAIPAREVVTLVMKDNCFVVKHGVQKVRSALRYLDRDHCVFHG